MWLFTSGSTGKPKAAVHLHHDFPFNTECYAKQVLGMRADDVTLGVPKLFFGYATGTNLMFPFAVGATTVLFAERADAREPVRAHRARHRPDRAHQRADDDQQDGAARPAAPRSLAPCALASPAGEALPARALPALEGALRRRDPRRHRLGRAVPHLHLQPPRRGAPGLARAGWCRATSARGASAPTATTSPTARSARCGSRATRPRSATGRRTRSPRRSCAATGWSPATCSAATPRATSATPAAPTTCSRWAASGSRRIEVESCLLRHPHVLEAAVIGYEDDDGLVKPLAYVVPKGAPPSAELAARDHRALQARAGRATRRRAASSSSRRCRAAIAARSCGRGAARQVKPAARRAHLDRGAGALRRAAPIVLLPRRLDRGARAAPAARHRHPALRGAGAARGRRALDAAGRQA